MVYHWLAVAYGRGGHEGHAKLALAEEALLRGDMQFATQQAKRAQVLLKNDPAGQQRAQDLLSIADRSLKRKKKDN
jgi:predicted Zn-dependent protease